MLDQFKKIQNAWKTRSASLSDDDIQPQPLFELGYHAVNDNPDRCIDLKLSGGDQGGEAVLFDLRRKLFKRVRNSEIGLDLTLWQKTEEGLDDLLQKVAGDLKGYKQAFLALEPDLKNQVAKAVLVERKIDEVVNRAMNKDNNRQVYFSVGEARERMANIPLLMEAEKSNLVQLALNKWMSATAKLSNDAPDAPVPADITPGLIKNVLQIKSWIRGVISKTLA